MLVNRTQEGLRYGLLLRYLNLLGGDVLISNDAENLIPSLMQRFLESGFGNRDARMLRAQHASGFFRNAGNALCFLNRPNFGNSIDGIAFNRILNIIR